MTVKVTDGSVGTAKPLRAKRCWFGLLVIVTDGRADMA